MIMNECGKSRVSLQNKIWSSTFSFAPKLALGLNNSRKNFRNFSTSFWFTPAPYIAEIFDGAGVNKNEVERFKKNFLELSRPRVNFGAKEKVELQTFVLAGHPREKVTAVEKYP